MTDLLEVREVEIFPYWRTEHQLEHVGSQQSVGAGYQSPRLLGWSRIQAAQSSVQEYRGDRLQSPPGGYNEPAGLINNYIIYLILPTVVIEFAGYDFMSTY